MLIKVLYILKLTPKGELKSIRSKGNIKIMSGRRIVVVVVLLFYVHGKHLRSCRDGQLTKPHFSWADLDLSSG